jgi:hypothetical protein
LVPQAGLSGVSGPIKVVLCRIVDMDFRERPFHALG